MKNNRLLFVLVLLLSTPLLLTEAVAQGGPTHFSMREVFIAMPDSLLPTVTKNNRLDCVDFIENNIEAKVRNTFDEYVSLEALTPDYACFRTSNSSVLEMKLLPATGTTQVLCVVSTVTTQEPDSTLRLSDSVMRLYTPDWHPLPESAQPLLAFVATDYVEVPLQTDSASTDVQKAITSLNDFHPLLMHLSPDNVEVGLQLQIAVLDNDERRALSGRCRKRKLHWNGTTFE